MKKNPLDIQHLSSADFAASPFEKVILPLGSLESHGGHLPFGTDALTAYLVALDIAARLPKTAVLPPLNYGVSEHYKSFPFTISVQFETEIAFLRDIFESIHRERIRKVFVMNGHDGNIAPIEIAARSAKVAHPDMKIVSLDAWWNMVGDILPADFFQVWKGLGHGGEGESSICLELFPELCDMSKARGVVPRLPKYVDVKWTFDELTNTGTSGDPTKGTKEKGRKMREVLVDTVVKILSDLDAKNWDYRSPEVAAGKKS
ncbi:MAG TPA: creatininase family protein [Spirochaetia bacterium]|nr:creatininase family protein [Spirochaetia bacterium]